MKQPSCKRNKESHYRYFGVRSANKDKMKICSMNKNSLMDPCHWQKVQERIVWALTPVDFVITSSSDFTYAPLNQVVLIENFVDSSRPDRMIPPPGIGRQMKNSYCELEQGLSIKTNGASFKMKQSYQARSCECCIRSSIKNEEHFEIEKSAASIKQGQESSPRPGRYGQVELLLGFLAPAEASKSVSRSRNTPSLADSILGLATAFKHSDLNEPD